MAVQKGEHGEGRGPLGIGWLGGSRQEADTPAHTGDNGDVRDTVTQLEEPRQRQRQQLRIVPHVQSDLSRIIYAHNGKRLLINIREKEGDAAQLSLVRFIAARTKGAHAWVS